MGFPIMRHVRVVKAETRANRYDRQTLVLVYVEKGKRRRTGTRFAENPFAIAKGWQPVNGTFNAEVEGNWTTFEPTAFQAMLDQLTEVIYSQSESEGTEAAPASLADPTNRYNHRRRKRP
ncbi:MAG: hypothetical protein H7Z11_23230 [Verrucomicrobia bacterium]|nr:hypothetical protein [Leptolyngbya sp. ES-bin-22]